MTEAVNRRTTEEEASAATSWDYIGRQLDSVVGLADMLRDRSRDASAAARNEMIEQLASRARTAKHALDDVVVAGQLAEGRLDSRIDSVALRESTDAAVLDLPQAHGANISVSGAVDAIGDERWVTLTVSNLLRNSIARGSKVIDVLISEGFSKAMLEVVDDGEPLTDEEVEALLSEHHRRQAVDWDGPWSGHGVAVARGLAKSMGGDVRYFREDDRNTYELTFRKQSRTTSPRRHIPDLTTNSEESRPTREDVAKLLESDAISVVYQPVVDMRVGDDATTVVGYESLARFPHSTPPEWFASAGSAGMGLDLELLAIRAGIEGFSSRKADSFLALNLSNATLLASRLISALDGIDPGRVVLELSDTARIRSYQTTRRTVDALRERGIRLAVDDVGADEIDLWHILRLDPEVIKLDRHLVADQENIRRNSALIRGITVMARDLGVMVVAEAVETEHERQRLLSLGVEFGQGYLFGKPAPLQWKTRVLSQTQD
jgi:EAL domain-containing protein (putative c-di-GMP-specific phosphodiesterase class I)